MPRLHYYFYGALITGGLYGIVYKRLYLPYTSHQREIELVLEAEKFVSQQLLQKVERLNRRVGIAPTSELPSLIATAYALYNEFEQSDCSSSALPKSLYVSRLKAIRERCGLLPFADDDRHEMMNDDDEQQQRHFTFVQQVRITLAYSIYYFLYRFSTFVTAFIVMPSPTIQRVSGDVILSLLNINPKTMIEMKSLQEEDALRRRRQDAELADAVNKDKVFEYKSPRDLEDELRKRPKRRDDEITLDDDNNDNNTTDNKNSNEVVVSSASQQQQNHHHQNKIVNIAHVSHWIEEFLVRYTMMNRKIEIVSYQSRRKRNNNNNNRSSSKKSSTTVVEDLSKEELVIRYFDPSEKIIVKEPTQPVQSVDDDDGKKQSSANNNSEEKSDTTTTTTSISSSSPITFTTPFICHGYPWFDQEFVDELVDTKEKEIFINDEENNINSNAAVDSPPSQLVLIRPITVTRGLNKILFKNDDADNNDGKKKKNNNNKYRGGKKKIHTKSISELSPEEQLALSEINMSQHITSSNNNKNSTSSSSSVEQEQQEQTDNTHQTGYSEDLEGKVVEIDEDGNIHRIKPSYDDLLRRRRTLVNPTRVKEEAEADKREQQLTELLYSGSGEEKKKNTNTTKTSGSISTSSNQIQTQSLDDIAAENDKKQREDKEQQEQQQKIVEEESDKKKQKLAGNKNNKVFVAGPLSVYNYFNNDDENHEEGNHGNNHQSTTTTSGEVIADDQQNNDHDVDSDNKEKKSVLIKVNIGKPCVPQEVWPCILRQFDAQTVEDE